MRNKEAIRQKNRRWREKNPNYDRDWKRDWREANPEKYKANRDEYNKRPDVEDDIEVLDRLIEYLKRAQSL
jgi:hypothetical protein